MKIKKATFNTLDDKCELYVQVTDSVTHCYSVTRTQLGDILSLYEIG